MLKGFVVVSRETNSFVVFSKNKTQFFRGVFFIVSRETMRLVSLVNWLKN
jgi:hypothetical protein